ncbi:MAG: transglutaminase-like domain-containing protein, partial [Bacteroidetes bacterium]|nr:transglutaminase-like domain-containing protein [Bacteroidota bacterium]
VGIPARMVRGCMYLPDNGGIFGQHAWTEIYMGEAGWVPVDPTIEEVNYIDAGHIRLGEHAAFLPRFIKVLDFEKSPSPAKRSEILKSLYLLLKY